MKKQTVNSFLSLQLSPLAPTISNQVFLDCFFQTSLGYHEPNFYTNDSKNMFSAAIFPPLTMFLKILLYQQEESILMPHPYHKTWPRVNTPYRVVKWMRAIDFAGAQNSMVQINHHFYKRSLVDGIQLVFDFLLLLRMLQKTRLSVCHFTHPLMHL